MAFRKFRRPFIRRRRRLPETYTWIQCSSCTNVYRDMTCTSPLLDAIPLLWMGMPRSPLDTTEASNPVDKFITLDGLKFQAEFKHDPAESLGCSQCDPSPINLAFFLTVWEAICVLPLAEGTTSVPARIPNLTNPNAQGGDLADRVLWKRITNMPIWGLSVGGGTFPQLTDTLRDFGHGPVTVKSRARLDDHNALFYVRAFVHDIAGLGSSNTDCPADCSGPTLCSIPVLFDGWWKMFYHTRK